MKEMKKLNMTEKQLDEALNSPEHQVLRNAISSLPEETLSLAWRSQLNERLRSAAPVAKRRLKWVVIVAPASALAASAALAMTLFLFGEQKVETNAPVIENTRSVEAAIVSAFHETSQIKDLVGYGLYAEELENTTKSTVDTENWSEDDLGTL